MALELKNRDNEGWGMPVRLARFLIPPFFLLVIPQIVFKGFRYFGQSVSGHQTSHKSLRFCLLRTFVDHVLNVGDDFKLFLLHQSLQTTSS